MNQSKRIADLCLSCGKSIYGSKAPSEQYAMRAAQLLFMTAAHESNGFRARRQYGFPQFPPNANPNTISRRHYAGAFGLWQCEIGSIQTSLFWMIAHIEVGHRAHLWLQSQGDGLGVTGRNVYDALCDVQYPSGDALSCLLGRVHYLRVPEAIPATIPEMAKYAKRYYNTAAGKARPSHYERAFETHWPY